jgi:magnesium-transporting ATPase (P-type)
VLKDEEVPVDLMVIKSSSDNNFCYFQTTNLDGETSLKPREAIINCKGLIKNEISLNYLNGYLEVDQPNNNIYSANGTLYLDTTEKCHFNIDNVLLRVNI